MNFMEIRSFYGELAKEKAIGESLAKRVRGISSEAELQKLIQDEIFPLARKMGYDFSEKDLLEYEKMVAQKLSPEDLLDVSGGVSLKSALLSGGIFSLAMLGFGALSPVQADAMVSNAAVESATGEVVAGARNDAVNTVEAQVQAAIKPELKDKISQEDVIQSLMRIISVSNTTAEQKESAINLLLKLVSDDKKEDLKTSIETIKSTLPAELTPTETNTAETLEKAKIKADILTLTNAKLADKLEAILNRSDKDSFLKELSTYTNFVEVYKEINPHQINIVSEEQFAAIKNEERYKNMLGSLFMLYKTLANAEAMPAADGLTFDEYQELRTFFDDYKKREAMVLFELCTERGVDKFLFKYDITAESIQSAITTLRREAAPSGGLESDKEKVLHSTGKVAKEAKDSQEIELSQTDYGYLLDAWNGAEALVYKLTGVTESFRFLNPTNRPTLVKKDGEKYFRWKYNEDSGDGFGELTMILFPCSDGGRIVVDGGAPDVSAFSRDCKPTAKLMAQIAALLYKYRTATPDEKEQINKKISAVLAKINMISDRLHHDKGQKGLNATFEKATSEQAEQNRQSIQKYEDLLKEYDELFAQVCTLFDQHQAIKTYNDSSSEDNKFNAMNIIKDISPKKLARDAEKKKQQQALIEKLKNWFGVATQLAASQDVKQFKKYENFTALKNKMEPLWLRTIAIDSKKVLNDDTLFTIGTFCDNVDHANTMLRLLTSAFYAIDNQEYEGEDYNDATPNKFAPKYFVEKMLMNFCIEHFNVEPGKPNPLELFYNEAKSLIKHNPTAESLTQTKQAGERIENTLKLLKKVEVSPLSPYKSGTAQNGNTYPISQVENRKVAFINDTFQDCADIAIRHVVNLLGYSVNKNWNVFFDGLLDQNGNFTEEAKEKLGKRFKAFESAASGHTQFEFLPLKDRLQLFFYHQSKVGVDATDKITRTLWEYAICNMNDQANLENGSLYQIRYNKEKNYELDTGHINSLKLVYNIAKALGLGTDKLDDAKAAIDELEVTFEQAKKDDPTGAKKETQKTLNTALKKAATATYQLISPAVKVNVSAVIDNRYQLDIWGKATATVEKSDGNEKEASSFDLGQNPGHGWVSHDPKVAVQFDTAELKSDVDKLWGKRTSDKYSDIATKTQLNKFHMLFGDFVKEKSRRSNPTGFKEDDPQYYKDFQALRFLKVAQGEEENRQRLENELARNPLVRKSDVKINLRETQGNKTTKKETPLALFAYENYCKDKSAFFSGAKRKDLIKKEIDFLAKWGAIEKVEQGGFTFVIEDGKATLALYEGKANEINIPQTVNGCHVTKIGDYCFYQEYQKQTIEKVTIPSTVEEIGEKAFYYCGSLTSVKFEPDSRLKIIGENAFEYCWKLSEITIPKSVERIESDAFFNCSKLDNITFENREKPMFIEPRAFGTCSFSNIDFPHNVQFGNSSLSLTRNLKTLTFTGTGEIKKENILKFLPYDGAGNFFKYNIEKLFDGKDSMQIDDKLTINLWGKYLSEDGTLDLSSFDIETFKTFKFARNNYVKRVIWPQGIDAIPKEMFSGCSSLEEVTIPNTVNEVGEQAFSNCKNLVKVAFDAGRTENLSIGSSIFDSNYKLTEVAIVDKITLYSGAFDGRKLEKIVIDADAENVQFSSYCFGYNDVNENLRIYVRNDAMKEKITKNKFLYVKPENVIVGLPQGNE